MPALRNASNWDWSRAPSIDGPLSSTSSSSSSMPLRLCCGVAAADTILLQPVMSWTSSFVVPMALMSQLTQSIHLCFGIPRFRLPGGTISRVFLPPLSWSRLFTWANHLSRAFLHLYAILSTFSLSLMFSFLTWCLSVWPHAHLHIFIYVTSSFFTWELLTGTVSTPYNIAG